MINCNPETVSTDYDTSDRLYFEPLTAEDVLAILDKEREAGTLKGVIVQFGGQTPLKLAHAIEQSGAPILGTSVDSIDLAEDRDRFKRLLDKLGLKQPKNGIAYSVEQSRLVAADLGLPLVVRPSYVLGGRAMAIIHDESAARRLSARRAAEPGARRRQGALSQRQDRPDQHGAGQEPAAVRPLSRRTRSRSTSTRCATARACSSPASWSISRRRASIPATAPARCRRARSSPETIARLEDETRKLALALDVGGLMNVQYALKDGEIYVLEVNPRASRTVPFVAKVIGQPIAKIAEPRHGGRTSGLVRPEARRASTTSASRRRCFPSRASPASTPCSGRKCARPARSWASTARSTIAFAKSQLGAGASLPRSGTVFVSVRDADKAGVVAPLRLLRELGFKIIATGGTQRYPRAARRSRGQDQQGVGRAPARGRRRAQRRRAADVQHHRGRDLARRFQAAAPRRPLAKNALLHHTFGRDRGGRGHQGLS